MEWWEPVLKLYQLREVNKMIEYILLFAVFVVIALFVTYASRYKKVPPDRRSLIW